MTSITNNAAAMHTKGDLEGSSMGRVAFRGLTCTLALLVIINLLAAPPTAAAQDDLITASGIGDLSRVKALLTTRVDIDARRANGSTALVVASEKGNLEIVKALLAAKATVDAPMGNGFTALMVAAGMGHLEVVQTLLAAKANVNAKAVPGVTALIYASQNGHLGIVRALLAAGADVNVKAILGTTALFMAAQQGHLDVVLALLAAGADANARTERGLTASMIASQRGHSDVAQILSTPPLIPDQPLVNSNIATGCSTTLTVQLETFGEGVTIELRQGMPGSSKVVGSQKSSGGTVFFGTLCQGSYFMAIGNEDTVDVTPVRQFEDNKKYNSRIVIKTGSGNVAHKSRRSL
jgi:hypothetical protein